MSTTLYRVDIIYVGVNILCIVCIIHDGNLYRNALFLCLEIDDIIKEVSAMAVNVSYKLFQTIFCMENLLFGFSFFVWTEICKGNLYTSIEKCQLAHTACDNIPFINGVGENSRVWPELLACTSLFSLTNNLDRVERLTFFVFLLIYFTFTEYLRFHV
ncbi:unknown [Prevotella sp. CAG:604]|nr:unknown [Prevotella sp. CAG:604]